MGSERLPGKSLIEIEGAPLLQHVLLRAQAAELVDQTVVATSESQTDDPIAEFCGQQRVRCVRGSEEDVLSRYVKAAFESDAAIVVRITGDNPLTHPPIVDGLVSRMLVEPALEYCFASNAPLGTACEALTYPALCRVDDMAETKEHREHVTLLIRERPELFRVGEVVSDLGSPGLRLTVDTEEDLKLMRALIKALGKPGEPVRVRDVIAYIDRNKELRGLNEHVKQRASGRPRI